MKIKWFFLAVLAFLLLLFVLQNIAPVEIQFLFWSARMSRSILMLAMLLIGIVIGWFIRSTVFARKNQKIDSDSSTSDIAEK